MEPLGRCVGKSRVYWDCAGRLCDMLLSVSGIKVINVPSRLKIADAAFFERESNGFIHLNSAGYGVLSDVYRKSLGHSVNAEHGIKQHVKPGGGDRFGQLICTLIEGLSRFQ